MQTLSSKRLHNTEKHIKIPDSAKVDSNKPLDSYKMWSINKLLIRLYIDNTQPMEINQLKENIKMKKYTQWVI